MNKFKLTVLGSGGAFATMEQGNSAFLVEYKERRILIDCGMTVPYVLRDEMGIPLQSITDIIITHAHGDHIGGLEQLLYSCYFLGNKKQPGMWMQEEVGKDTISSLNCGMRWLHGQPYPMGIISLQATFFGGCYSRLSSRFQHCCGGLPLEFREVTHVEQMPATSVRLGPLFISGDTNAPVCPPHDCQLVFHEAEFGFATGVHCPVEELDTAFKELLPDGSALYHPLREKTWLYHCPPSIVDAPEGFAGILKKGQVFELEIP